VTSAASKIHFALQVFFLDPTKGALALAIRAEKESIRKNCLPVPPLVAAKLSRFFPSDVFSGVCYAFVRNGFTLSDFAIKDAEMAAITFEDAIVFRDAWAANDPVLWSHELTHVMQYRRLGVEGFAALYPVAFDQLEQEARLFDQFAARVLQQTPNPTVTYWKTSTGWSVNQRITPQQYASYAKQSIDPTRCYRFQMGGNQAGVWTDIFNNCPIPITLINVTRRAQVNGYTVDTPCIPSQYQVCTIGPSQSLRIPRSPGWDDLRMSIAW